jgi:NTE family protein
MTTAFVLSGGGSLGAIQVGMLQALGARRIEPDLLVGTSAGALNAAFVAGHGMSEASLDELATIWTNLRRADVFPLQLGRFTAATLGWVPSLCPNDGLRRLVDRHLVFDRLEDARVPVHVVATDVRSGHEVLISEGDAVEAVLASAAVPAVLPAVRLGNRDLIDGGVADNTAISLALELGADVVYVLPTGYACALENAPRTVLGNALHALTLLIEQRLVLEVAHYAEHADIRVLPPLCPLSVSSADFRHGALLIKRARISAARWLNAGGHQLPHPERFLSLHDHPPFVHALPARRATSTPSIWLGGGGRHDAHRNDCFSTRS